MERHRKRESFPLNLWLRHEIARLIVWHVVTRMESKDGVRAASQQWISAQRSPHRTSSRVGHQRVALTGTFPMAPLQTARESFDLKQLSSGLLRASLASCPDLLRRSASRVPHRRWACDHLCHFPLCTALPCALVGRDSHEYYWHSVTLGLASYRPSRVPSQRNVIERRRLPIHPLQCPRWASAIAQGVP